MSELFEENWSEVFDRYVWINNKIVDDKLYDRWVLHHTNMSFEDFKKDIRKSSGQQELSKDKKEETFIEDRESFDDNMLLYGVNTKQ